MIIPVITRVIPTIITTMLPVIIHITPTITTTIPVITILPTIPAVIPPARRPLGPADPGGLAPPPRPRPR